MAALGETVAVIDKSGKIVSTSKHLFGVFKEARSAYRDRKAEIKAGRQSKKADKEVLDAQRALEAYSLEDSRSVSSTRRNAQRSKSVGRHRGHASSRHHSHQHSQRRRSHYEQDFQSAAVSRQPSRRDPQSLARRHTSHDGAIMEQERPHPGTRSHSAPHVDMDLAYGEFHPSSIEENDPDPEQEVKGLVGKVKMALDEADCAQKSVTAIVAHLQKHPDAMAAVALTLAEISNLVTKMAPATLATLKTSAPAVFALLASPQFMIAAGVGLGVTVVMFGGYKIVKQIQNKKENASNGEEGSMDEMVELSSRVSKIEHWRRGVADSGANSVGTSVDGEFITPTAASMSGIRLPSRVNEVRREEVAATDAGSQYSRRSRSTRASRSSRRSKTSKAPTSKDKTVKDKKDKDKTKKPSPLRMLLFKK